MRVPLWLRLFHNKDQEPFLCYIRKQFSTFVAELSYSLASPLSRSTSITCVALSARSARNVTRSSALRAANQLMVRRVRNQRKVRMTMISFTVPICRASFLALALRCLSSYITTNFNIHLAPRTRSEQASVEKRIPLSILP